ncbi:MAG: glycosyl hydrolase [Rhodospirillaceae bacterium]|nr:glycosyl hydrolase [Rhodospirillaceae bacterium]
MEIRNLQPSDLSAQIDRLWPLSAAKIDAIDRDFDLSHGAPVFTVDGRYTARGWTEWTQGFQFGSAILQFDATGEARFLDLGRQRTRDLMAPHLTHFGVHDHGFNNVSTYGALLRLAAEGRIDADPWEQEFYRLALKVSGAVQAGRWTALPEDLGYIPSFNGPHSLFIDTIRSLRALALGHRLGHVLMEEGDARVSLLARLAQHAVTTARYNIFYGDGRDIYDIRGRTAHEAIFNVRTGAYRCPSTQQGYAPFSTWTRGLAWAICGYAEQLEFLATLAAAEIAGVPHGPDLIQVVEDAARATADFYIANSAADGIPYWDTGAPGLDRLGDWRSRPSEPLNAWEPVDSSAAAIAAQGLMRLGHHLGARGDAGADRYMAAGLTVLATLLDTPYLCADPDHHGLILHSQYHRPNGWDHVPAGSAIPNGEATMWGDYHAREAALYVQRLAAGAPYLAFFAIDGAAP